MIFGFFLIFGFVALFIIAGHYAPPPDEPPPYDWQLQQPPDYPTDKPNRRKSA